MSVTHLFVVAASGSPSPSAPAGQWDPMSPMPGENDPNWIGPGLFGFLSLVFLIVAVVVIWRSMNTQLRRVRFDEGAPTTGAPASDPAVAVATTAPAVGGTSAPEDGSGRPDA